MATSGAGDEEWLLAKAVGDDIMMTIREVAVRKKKSCQKMKAKGEGVRECEGREVEVQRHRRPSSSLSLPLHHTLSLRLYVSPPLSISLCYSVFHYIIAW